MVVLVPAIVIVVFHLLRIHLRQPLIVHFFVRVVVLLKQIIDPIFRENRRRKNLEHQVRIALGWAPRRVLWLLLLTVYIVGAALSAELLEPLFLLVCRLLLHAFLGEAPQARFPYAVDHLFGKIWVRILNKSFLLALVVGLQNRQEE